MTRFTSHTSLPSSVSVCVHGSIKEAHDTMCPDHISLAGWCLPKWLAHPFVTKADSFVVVAVIANYIRTF